MSEVNIMPNHVTSRIQTRKGIIDQCISDNEGSPFFDFAKVIPVPSALFTENVSSELVGRAKLAMGYADLENKMKAAQKGGLLDGMQASSLIREASTPINKDRFKEKEIESFLLLCKSLCETGYAYWYDWNVENWGTKWGAYDFERVSDTEIKFQTAWSAPHKIIEAISKNMLPEGVGLRHQWADEDTGHNVGSRIYKGSELSLDEEYSKSKKGYELAFELCGGGENYKLNPQTDEYEYVEDD